MFITKAKSLPASAECPTDSDKDKVSVWCLFWGGQSVTWRQVNYIRHFLPWRGQPFNLTGIDTHSEYKFSFCLQTLSHFHYLRMFLLRIVFTQHMTPYQIRAMDPFERKGNTAGCTVRYHTSLKLVTRYSNGMAL